MSDLSRLHFTSSRPLTLGVELELQLISLRDYDLTRAATDLLGGLRYDDRFGEIKLDRRRPTPNTSGSTTTGTIPGPGVMP